MASEDLEAEALATPTRWTFGKVLRGIVFPAAFMGLLLWFLWAQRDQLEPLGHARRLDIALISILVLVSHFMNSTEFWLLYRSNGAESGIFENWFLFLGGLLANYLPAQAGTIYRLRYMRAVHGVSYARSTSVYGANFVVTLAGAGGAALFGVLGAALIGGDDLSVIMLLIAIGLVTMAFAMAVIPLPKFAARRGRLARAWRSVHAGFEQIRGEPATAGAVVAIEIAKYFVTAWRFAIAFHLIGIHASYWTYIVLAAAAGVANFVAVTPGAFGFREVFVTGAAAAMGLSLDSGLLGATIDRAVMLGTTIVFGVIGLLITYPRLRAATADLPSG